MSVPVLPGNPSKNEGQAHIEGAARAGADACQPEAVGQLGQLGRPGFAAAEGASLAAICGALAESGGGAAVAGAQICRVCGVIPPRVCTAVVSRPATMRGSGCFVALHDTHTRQAG